MRGAGRCGGAALRQVRPYRCLSGEAGAAAAGNAANAGIAPTGGTAGLLKPFCPLGAGLE